MKQYKKALEYILEHGQDKSDRTGVGTRSVFGYQMRFDLSEGFPVTTTKKIAWKSVVSELLWFLEGSSDERRLAEILHGTRDENKKTIWTANAQADYWKPKAQFEGDLGKVYGYQWRNFNGVDQLQNLIDNIKKDPYGRRHILTAWNPSELDQMALPPCHVLSQFDVTDGQLSCQLYQRSVDAFLGLSFNIASYSLLTHMIAQICDLGVGDFIHTSGDLHLYNNHFDQTQELLSRDPLPLPDLWLNPDIKEIDKFTMEDILLIDYQSHKTIKAPMAL